MATEINAGENYEYSDLFDGSPSGKTRELLTGDEVDDYHNTINFHGNRNEALEFIDEVENHIPHEVSVTINFDNSTNLKSAYIDIETLNLKVKDINFIKDGEYIDNSLKNTYEVSVEDDKRKILAFYPETYIITTKEHAVNREDIEFLVDAVNKNRSWGPFDMEPVSQYFEFPVENQASQVAKFSPYFKGEGFQLTFESGDGNGIEPAFREQVENILKEIPNLKYTVEINEPYLDENRHRVENYLRINEAGNVQIYGIPKELDQSREADRTFREMKEVLKKHYNDDKEIFATRPEFGLKVLEGPQDEMESFDEEDETQYAFSGTVKYDDYGYKEIKKLDSENTFMETGSFSLQELWKDFQKYSKYTTDALVVSEKGSKYSLVVPRKDSKYSISDCMIDGFESFNIVHSEQVANYDVLDFSRENNLKLLVVDDSDFSPYGFRNDETWALIENGNIKIAMSEENFDDWIESEGGKQEAIDYLKESTGLKETEKRFKNIEIQIYDNEEHWNDNFFKEKEIAEKIILKQEKNEKTESKNKKETKTR